MPRVVIPFFSYWGKNDIRSWAGGNDIEFPAPPFRVQRSRLLQRLMSFYQPSFHPDLVSQIDFYVCRFLFLDVALTVPR